jgi:hypothetical protein
VISHETSYFYCTYTIFSERLFSPTTIYGFWLRLWHLQTLLDQSIEKYVIFIELSIVILSVLKGNNSYQMYIFKIKIGNVKCSIIYFSLLYNNTLISWNIQKKKQRKVEMTLWWIYFRNKNVDILFITHDAVLWQPPSAISKITYFSILWSRRVWRCQRRNQNPYIEEGQTTQWPKEKVHKDKQRSTKKTTWLVKAKPTSP